jgi:hypothetical protein
MIGMTHRWMLSFEGAGVDKYRGSDWYLKESLEAFLCDVEYERHTPK